MALAESPKQSIDLGLLTKLLKIMPLYKPQVKKAYHLHSKVGVALAAINIKSSRG